MNKQIRQIIEEFDFSKVYDYLIRAGVSVNIAREYIDNLPPVAEQMLVKVSKVEGRKAVFRGFGNELLTATNKDGKLALVFTID